MALEAGWFVTEFGRQPWIARGLLRTSDAVTIAPGIDLAVLRLLAHLRRARRDALVAAAAGRLRRRAGARARSPRTAVRASTAAALGARAAGDGALRGFRRRRLRRRRVGFAGQGSAPRRAARGDHDAIGPVWEIESRLADLLHRHCCSRVFRRRSPISRSACTFRCLSRSSASSCAARLSCSARKTIAPNPSRRSGATFSESRASSRRFSSGRAWAASAGQLRLDVAFRADGRALCGDALRAARGSVSHARDGGPLREDFRTRAIVATFALAAAGALALAVAAATAPETFAALLRPQALPGDRYGDAAGPDRARARCGRGALQLHASRSRSRPSRSSSAGTPRRRRI